MIVYYRFFVEVEHSPNGEVVDPMSGGVGQMILLYLLGGVLLGGFSIWKQEDKKGWIGVSIGLASIIAYLVL